MNKTDIINNLAKDQAIEKIINKIGGGPIESAQDLAQDLYVNLLCKDDELIERLYETNSLGFFIIKMVKNNIFSKSSPYYSNYISYLNKTTTLNEEATNKQDS